MGSPLSNLSAAEESQINFVLSFKPNSEQGRKCMDVCYPIIHSLAQLVDCGVDPDVEIIEQ